MALSFRRIAGDILVGDVTHQRLHRGLIRVGVQLDGQWRKSVDAAAPSTDDNPPIGNIRTTDTNLPGPGAFVVDRQPVIGRTRRGKVYAQQSFVEIDGIGIRQDRCRVDDRRRISFRVIQ